VNNGNTILKTEGLAAGYGSHTVLKGVSFDLQQGEVLAIIGQNGSGKSTLLKTLGGLLPIKAGTILFQNRPVKHIQPHSLVKSGISLLLQGGMIIPSLTVLENMELAVLAVSRKLQKTAFDITFTEFPKLKEMQQKKAGNLSGGERQMLSLAVLQLQNTNLWYLDEPTAGLAPDLVKFTIDFLSRKNKQGIAMIIVEHNMDVAMKLATHIAVTKEGTLTKKFNQTEFLESDFLKNAVYN
jgi:ABC-type branched-subunit amino acid transport system ATPase component